MPGHQKIRRLVLPVLLLLSMAWAFHGPLLAAAGRYLAFQDPLERCDALVVLLGEDGDGLRVQDAARYYRQGWASKVVLSGGPRIFGTPETVWSLPWALHLGIPRESVLVMNHDARNPWGEASILVPELEKQGIRSVILITSPSNAREVRVSYRKAAKDRVRILVRTVSSPWFEPSSWWYSREGWKSFFFGCAGLVEAWLH